MTPAQIDRFYDGFIRAQYMTDKQIETELDRDAHVHRQHKTDARRGWLHDVLEDTAA